MRRRTLLPLLVCLLPAAPLPAATIIFDNLTVQPGTPSSPMTAPDSWLAQKFIPQTAATLDSVILRMSATPLSEGLPVAELYSDNGTSPGSSLGFLISPSEQPPWSATNVAFGCNGPQSLPA